MSNFFEFKAEDTRCEVHSMEKYRGKVVLVVNTATQCGFTPQYDDLQDLYEKYQEEGLEILDVTNSEIRHREQMRRSFPSVMQTLALPFHITQRLR